MVGINSAEFCEFTVAHYILRCLLVALSLPEDSPVKENSDRQIVIVGKGGNSLLCGVGAVEIRKEVVLHEWTS